MCTTTSSLTINIHFQHFLGISFPALSAFVIFKLFKPEVLISTQRMQHNWFGSKYVLIQYKLDWTYKKNWTCPKNCRKVGLFGFQKLASQITKIRKKPLTFCSASYEFLRPSLPSNTDFNLYLQKMVSVCIISLTEKELEQFSPVKSG